MTAIFLLLLLRSLFSFDFQHIFYYLSIYRSFCLSYLEFIEFPGCVGFSVSLWIFWLLFSPFFSSFFSFWYYYNTKVGTPNSVPHLPEALLTFLPSFFSLFFSLCTLLSYIQVHFFFFLPVQIQLGLSYVLFFIKVSLL